MADLSVNVCGVTLKNPVIPASGTFGFGREFNELYDISCLGLTLKPRLGNPVPRIAEGRSVILNAVGLQNPGVDAFLEHDLAWLKQKTRVLANVAGSTIEDYAQICARARRARRFCRAQYLLPQRKVRGHGVRHPPRDHRGSDARR